MATVYSSLQSASYSWGTGKTRCYNTATTSSTNTVTTVTVEGAVQSDSTYSMYQYGVECQVGHSAAGGVAANWDSTTAMINYSNWVAKISRSYEFPRGHDNYSVTVWTKYWGNNMGGSYTGCTQSDELFQSVTIPKLASYTVSYNANGGSWSGSTPSSTKWYGETLTLTTTEPTRIGYKFKGWGTSASATSTQTTYTGNSATTFYAVWEEYALTVNYYSNYATASFSGATNAVGADKNVIVRTAKFYYDDKYDDGLHNYTSTSAGTYLGRTGYTGTGYWGTTTSGGTIVSQDKSFSTGQALAEAYGKSLKTGNASVNVYAQWRENYLTVNYYSNYASTLDAKVDADYFESDTQRVVYSGIFSYANKYPNGLFNYTSTDDEIYMTRRRYEGLGYWCSTPAEDVKLEPDKKTSKLLYDGGFAIGQDKGYNSGQLLAEDLGLSLKNGDATIDLYAYWKLKASEMTVYVDGEPIRGLVHIYDDDGNRAYGIVTVYDENGKAKEVI